MQLGAEAAAGVGKPIQILAPITVGLENRAAIVPSLNHMLWLFRDGEPR